MAGNLKYYTDKSIFDATGRAVFHGFFTHLGGVSDDPCSGLNCGLGSDDDAANVKINRELVASEIGVAPDALLALYQVHGSTVVHVDEASNERPKADAYVTDRAGMAISIVTADCAPVMFYGQKPDNTSVIGVAHAGWRGALGGILESTVEAMINLGADKGSIRACVGPCISKSSYEVGIDFITPFINDDPQSEQFFQSSSSADHFMFDLSGYCAAKLFGAGVKNITLMDKDTYANEAEFFSFRRATHRAEKDYGRQISAICIK